jgi:hypothetical protein
MKTSSVREFFFFTRHQSVFVCVCEEKTGILNGFASRWFEKKKKKKNKSTRKKGFILSSPLLLLLLLLLPRCCCSPPTPQARSSGTR